MTASRVPLLEHGFWDYTTPGAGGMEGYARDDYHALLDDMSAAGMNSVLVMPKWLTTGYRSRLPFLDQHADNPVTASGNELLRDFFAEAKRRAIKTWLGAVVTVYPTRAVAARPHTVWDGVAWGCAIPGGYGQFDVDTPGVADMAVAVCEEVVSEFPGVDGFMLEAEFSGYVSPGRIPLYDAWASAHGRPAFDDMVRRLDGRTNDLGPWREYTTRRRADLALRIEAALRAKGFRGELATLAETGRAPHAIAQEVDLPVFARECPGWAAVSYEYSYDKDTPHRLGMMEMAVTLPKRAGMKTYYLPRGVMTWSGGAPWPMSIDLRESWRREWEDIERFRPDGVWWFGSGVGAKATGSHVDAERLRRSGFESGRAARRALIEMLQP